MILSEKSATFRDHAVLRADHATHLGDDVIRGAVGLIDQGFDGAAGHRINLERHLPGILKKFWIRQGRLEGRAQALDQDVDLLFRQPIRLAGFDSAPQPAAAVVDLAGFDRLIALVGSFFKAEDVSYISD
jgi:hypothetical protein